MKENPTPTSIFPFWMRLRRSHCDSEIFPTNPRVRSSYGNILYTISVKITSNESMAVVFALRIRLQVFCADDLNIWNVWSQLHEKFFRIDSASHVGGVTGSARHTTREKQPKRNGHELYHASGDYCITSEMSISASMTSRSLRHPR